MNLLIVEDNKIDGKRCMNLVRQVLPDINIFLAETGKQVEDILDVSIIDAAMIDIELPDTDGFSVAERIREDKKYYTTPIMFVTGYGNDSLELHKMYHHYDYICKPYTDHVFLNCIKKFLYGIKSTEDLILNDSEPKKRFRTILLMRRVKNMNNNGSRGISLAVKYDDILFAETSKHYIVLHTKNGIISDIPMDLHEFEDYVGEHTFQRCHQSYIVNINNIHSIVKSGRKVWEIFFDSLCNEGCLLSQKYRKDILTLQEENLLR